MLAERHSTSEGSEYVRITFGQPLDGGADVDDPSRVIDAEFLFLKGTAPGHPGSFSCLVEMPSTAAKPESFDVTHGQGIFTMHFPKRLCVLSVLCRKLCLPLTLVIQCRMHVHVW